MSGKREWFRFVTAKAKNQPAEVFVYGDIGETFWGDGVSAQSFVDQLNEIDAAELHVRINSPGGSAWDGMTIANAIMRHPAKTTTFIDGLAASAASIVAFAGDEVVVSKWGRAMLHNAHAMVAGTANDMRDVATQLDALNANMATYYADRATGGDDAAAFARAMEKETWYSAQELIDAGLATRIDDSGVREEVEKAVASALSTARMKFQHPPAATTKEIRMATKDDLAKRLGKDPADVTDEDLMKAALDALGDAPADDPKDTGATGDPAPADPAAPPAGDPTP
ncbi:Clp protease ClpP, partial [Mycobacteriaceae bacterium Msp059]|nr:Clp protease ClpP [Mycobacteriaceae bacterium Msp059]